MSSPVAFVLVGTRSPGNAGAICRMAKAFGFPDVRLVAEQYTYDSDEAMRLAHGAEDILQNALRTPDLAAATQDCFRTVATTARPRDWSRPVLLPSELSDTLAEWRETRPPEESTKLGLVFGPEDRGLSNDDLAQCDAIVSIPMPRDPQATLSLPAAATILGWELSQGLRHNTRRPAARSDLSARAARTLDSPGVDRLVDELEAALSTIDFRPRPNATRFRGSLRDFLARAQVTEGDHLFLRHMCAQIGKWSRRFSSGKRT